MFKSKRRTIIILVVAFFLICTYFGCLFTSIFYDGGIVTNPIKMIGWIRSNGFPTIAALIVAIFLFASFASVGLDVALIKGQTDNMGRPFRQPLKSRTYGGAHFEGPKEYKDTAIIKNADEAIGPILGQLDTLGNKLICALTKKKMGNMHMAVFGRSGSGKSFTCTLNLVLQCIRRRESMVISDPDGGLERDLRGHLEESGYVVRTLNLRNLHESSGWNCLSSIASDDPEVVTTKIQIFTQTCLQNAYSGDATSGNIYFNGPLELFKALVMRVWFGHDFKEKTLKTVVEQLKMPNIEQHLDKLFDPSVLVDEDEKRCLTPWASFLASSANLKGNLISNLGTMLGVVLDSPLLGTLLSTEDIDLLLPSEQPCCYFCRIPDTHSTFTFVSSLFFSMMTQCLVDKADSSPGGKLPVPVNFIMDEFASIGVLPDWERVLSVARKRQINITMIFQDVTQLQKNYKDSWVTILGNCEMWLSLAVNDEYTASLIQSRIGTTTVQVQSTSSSPDENILDVFSGSRRSIGEGKRDLLSKDEIMKLDPNMLLVLIAHHNPILAYKFPVTSHPDSDRLGRPDPLGVNPPLTDEKARKARAEREQTFLAAYYCKYPDQIKTKDEVAKKDIDYGKAVIIVTLRRCISYLLHRPWKQKTHKQDNLVMPITELPEAVIVPDEEQPSVKTVPPVSAPQAVQTEPQTDVAGNASGTPKIDGCFQTMDDVPKTPKTDDYSRTVKDVLKAPVHTPVTVRTNERKPEPPPVRTQKEPKKAPDGPCTVRSNREMSMSDLDAIFAEIAEAEAKPRPKKAAARSPAEPSSEFTSRPPAKVMRR